MLLLRLALICALVESIRADCYSRDKVKALDSQLYIGRELIPCGNGSNNCCLEGEKCGTNLLCSFPRVGVFRQYCSDPFWNNCSNLCPYHIRSGLGLVDCENNIYCCSSDTSRDCCTDERAFYVDPDNGEVWNTHVPAKTKSAVWFTIDSSSILAGTNSVASSSSSTSTQTSAYLSTTSTSESTVPGTTMTNPPGPSSKNLSAGAGAGIGIGAAVGVAVVVAAISVFLRKRKRNILVNVGQGVSEYTGPVPVDDRLSPLHKHYSSNEPAPSEVGGTHNQVQELCE